MTSAALVLDGMCSSVALEPSAFTHVFVLHLFFFIVFEMRRTAWRFVVPRAGSSAVAVRRLVLHARAIIALVFVFVFALDRGRCPRNFPLDSSASARVDGALGCSLILAMTPLWLFLSSQDMRAWGALLRLSQRCAQRASSYVAGLSCVTL